MLCHGTKSTGRTNTHSHACTSSCNAAGSRIAGKSTKNICCLLPSPIFAQDTHNRFVGLRTTHFCDGIHTNFIISAPQLVIININCSNGKLDATKSIIF